MSDKQYFDAYVVVSKRYNNSEPTLFLRVDGYDYWSKKLGRQAELCDYIELPYGMTGKQAKEWIKQEFADNAVYQLAVAGRSRRTTPELTAQERLAVIRQRVLNQHRVMEQLQQEEQDIMALLAAASE